MPANMPTFRFRGWTVEFDLPHLAFATAIAGWCGWFCYDAWQAQRDVENLILIVPASAAALMFYAAVAAGCFRVVSGTTERLAPRKALAPGIAFKIVGTMVMLTVYAVSAPLIGFDVATFVYVLAMLVFLGERRIVVLVLVPALLCCVVVYGFGTVLATPLPLLLFPGDAS